MKTKALVATLLIAAAASADARFAPPYPRKPLPPDEIGQWMVINGNPWRQGAESELTTFADGQTRRGEASPCAAATEKSPPTKEKFRTSGKDCVARESRE
jgi:hypothetical protein